ncbi:MAG: carbohydrate porin, partial [Woeseiaceae bacterium]
MHRLKSDLTIPALAVLALGLTSGASISAQETESAADEAEESATEESVPTISLGPDDVSTRIESDSLPPEVAYDLAGSDKFFEPWSNWKGALAEEELFRLGMDYQPLMQWSDNSEGEDSAAGGIFRVFSSWDIWGTDNPSRTGTLDVRLEHRHKIGSDIPPENLAPGFGYLGTTAPDWTDQGLGVTNLMIRQRLDVGKAPVELRVGYMSAFAQFDITMFSDNLTTFQNNSLILSPTIAYPSAGSFGVAGYVGIPDSKFYVLGMVMDANGQYDSLSFDTVGDGEYFSALEFGWSEMDLAAGSGYVLNNFHIGAWHSDKRGKGAQATGSYFFQDSRFGVFGRIAWASEGASTIYKDYAAVGGTMGFFRDSMLGVGISTGKPQGLNNSQVATEIFYRWQLSQYLALTPSVQFLKDPALNADDSSVTVLSLRFRVSL